MLKSEYCKLLKQDKAEMEIDNQTEDALQLHLFQKHDELKNDQIGNETEKEANNVR